MIKKNLNFVAMIGEAVIPGTVKGMTYVNPNAPGTLVTVELGGYVKGTSKNSG